MIKTVNLSSGDSFESELNTIKGRIISIFPYNAISGYTNSVKVVYEVSEEAK
jgi:hypothetical protein